MRSKLSTCRHESWQVYFISLQASSLVAGTGRRERATEPAKLVVRMAILVTSFADCVALLRFLVPAISESACRLLLYLQSLQCIEYETEYVIYLPKTNVQFQKISILPPTEGIGISWRVGGSVRPKNLKKCIKLKWNFPSVGEVWIFSGITHFNT